MMNERQKRDLARQLRQQAAAIETTPDASLLVSLLTTGNTLLKAAEAVLPTAPLSQEALQNSLYSHCCTLTTMTDGFWQQLNRCTQDSLRQPPYADLRERCRAAKEQTETARQQRQNLSAETTTAEAALTAAQQALAAAQTEHTRLQNALKDYSAAAITRQEQENRRLLGILSQAEQQMQTMAADNTTLQERLEQFQRDLWTIPTENKRLLDEYKKQQTLLEELHHAQETCSPEKQAALQTEIDKLSPEVTAHQKAAEALQARKQALSEQLEQVSGTQQQLSTETLQYINDFLATVRPLLTAEQDAIQQTVTTADTFQKNLAHCLSQQQRYHHWLTADRTPLTAMMAHLSVQEAQQLHQTLDLSAIDSIKELMKRIEKDLGELDAIVMKATGSVMSDYQTIKDLARR